MKSQSFKDYHVKIANQLDAVRRMVCPYGAGENESCDCKYGISNETQLIRSEQTGCPELRDLVKIYRMASQ